VYACNNKIVRSVIFCKIEETENLCLQNIALQRQRQRSYRLSYERRKTIPSILNETRQRDDRNELFNFEFTQKANKLSIEHLMQHSQISSIVL
jgi:hypothetical protein